MLQFSCVTHGSLRCMQGQSAEEARARLNALARMRSLLLRHADKARHLKKIKSKDFHRRTIRAARAKVQGSTLCSVIACHVHPSGDALRNPHVMPACVLQKSEPYLLLQR